MKLDTPLFNAVLEQVRRSGPDSDCRCDFKGPMSAQNQVFVDSLEAYHSLARIDVRGALATAFFIGFESGLQYAKVSQEVKELNKLI